MKTIVVRGCYTCQYFYEPDVKCTNPDHRHLHMPKIECKHYKEKKEE